MKVCRKASEVFYILQDRTSPAHIVQAYRTVFQTIDQIHCIDYLPQSIYARDRFSRATLRGVDGRYLESPSGAPFSIEVRANLEKGLHLVITHEIGHCVDYALQQAPERSRRSRLTLALRQEALPRLESLVQGTEVCIAYAKAMKEPTEVYQERLSHLLYLKTDREIFARAYTQYIAQVSDNSLLSDELEARLLEDEASGIPTQWQREAFREKCAMFDELFTSLGWRQ